MKKVLRSIQTLFPFLHDLRFSFKFWIMGITKNPHEDDFNALRFFKPPADQIFLDIGSNRGEAISSMLTFNKFKNTVVGFEPNPLIFNKLESHFKKNDRVTVHNCGLGNENQDHMLFIPFYRRWMFDGLSSFIREEAEDWLKTRLWNFNENKLTIKELNCKIRRLDDYNLNPYFVKIDVQGFELEVLKGGTTTIATHRPILLIESISADVMDFLSKYDYQFYKYEGSSLVQGQGSLNTYCITSEKHEQL